VAAIDSGDTRPVANTLPPSRVTSRSDSRIRTGCPGNTSAASIPLAMADLLATGAAKAGDLALLIGYGAGLSYAAQVVVMPNG